MRLAAFLSIILILGNFAGGQTTQPSGQPSGPDVATASWERQVSSLAAAIAAHDSPGLQALVQSGCQVRNFDGQRDADLASLFDFISDKSVLGDHAYPSHPATVAADIARDVNSSGTVSDSIKRSLDLDEKQNQPVVLRWLAQWLGTVDGPPIAVIVLWQNGPDPDDSHRPNFILIKGEKDGEQLKFGEIVYGDPLQ